tara:strand:- start:125 stop:352 length:228 start_codon:yes stop_codon:yes gene_type:complete
MAFSNYRFYVLQTMVAITALMAKIFVFFVFIYDLNKNYVGAFQGANITIDNRLPYVFYNLFKKTKNPNHRRIQRR